MAHTTARTIPLISPNQSLSPKALKQFGLALQFLLRKQQQQQQQQQQQNPDNAENDMFSSTT